MQTNLLQFTWANFAIDAIVVFVIVAFAITSAKRGFISCCFGLLSTVVAVVVAFVLMKPVLSWTSGLFGLQPWIENACIGGFGKIAGFDIDVSSAGIQEALAGKNLPSFLIDVIVESVGNEEVAKGTTLAMIAGTKVGELATTLVAWLALFLVTKLLLKLVQSIINSIVENVPIIDSLNHLLGFGVGALQGFLIVCAVIAVLGVIPAEGVTLFLSDCVVVGNLYNHNPLPIILGWIIH